jgi:hypothetical protein
MDQATTSPVRRDGITRRDAIHYVATLMGGVALVGGDRAFAFAPADAALLQATAQGVGAFTAADVALLDEIAETILPETATPGAKAARTGAFMALMVTDVYLDAEQRVFRDGLAALQEACRGMHGVAFMAATPAQRLALLEVLDREQKTAMEERSVPLRTRYPADPPPEQQPAHYFRMMKELALLGFFTSEIGYTKVMRYRESPGRFDPDVPYTKGEAIWAPHS